MSYNVYQDNVKKVATEVTEAELTNLSPATTYSIAVSETDGTEESSRTAVTVTTNGRLTIPTTKELVSVRYAENTIDTEPDGFDTSGQFGGTEPVEVPVKRTTVSGTDRVIEVDPEYHMADTSAEVSEGSIFLKDLDVENYLQNGNFTKGLRNITASSGYDISLSFDNKLILTRKSTAAASHHVRFNPELLNFQGTTESEEIPVYAYVKMRNLGSGTITVHAEMYGGTRPDITNIDITSDGGVYKYTLKKRTYAHFYLWLPSVQRVALRLIGLCFPLKTRILIHFIQHLKITA